jgi:threonyl-tRNA synthetase
MLVIGDKEQETGTIAPRKRDGTDLKRMALEQFLTLIQEERKIPTVYSF